MILKPGGFAIWDAIKNHMDGMIKEYEVQNAYFPLLLPVSYLNKEAKHVEGFAKECAVVTHHRLKSIIDDETNEVLGVVPDPDAQLGEPLVIRPTSETIIWDAFHRWIHSHRDLPLLTNQWANVVRWEMKTRPFLRTSEFLWQEGHTAHATEQEAIEFSRRMQDMYEEFIQDILAIPVIPGEKSACERFAGADITFTCEAMMGNGWALQAATSHFLGQHFSKAFDVQYQTQDGKREYVWSTSWGSSTRLIGGVIMCHGDDKGIVLPPAIAQHQVTIVPIFSKKDTEEEKRAVLEYAARLQSSLRSCSTKWGRLRVTVDKNTESSPGQRFYDLERKGIPLRIEIGKREIESERVSVKLRTGNKRMELPSEGLGTNVVGLLHSMQQELLSSARQRLDENLFCIERFEEMLEHPAFVANNKDFGADEESFSNRAPVNIPSNNGDKDTAIPIAPMFLAPWHADPEMEKRVKAETKYTIRCYPRLMQQVQGKTCMISGRPATHIALFARAF